MNERQTSLVALFADEPQTSATASQLGSRFACTGRTIRSDVRIVNEWLDANGYRVRIVGERGRGFHIEQEDGDLQRALEQLAVSAPASTSHVELFINGMAHLLLTDERFSIASLARRLYVSHSVLTRELRRWDSMLSTYGIELVRRPHLHIEGPEERVRMCFVSHLFLLAPEATRRTIAPQLMGDMAEEIERTVLRVIPESVRFSRNAREQLALMYVMAVRRTRLGHHIAPNTLQELAFKKDEPEVRSAAEAAGALGLEYVEHAFLARAATGCTVFWTPAVAEQIRPRNPEATHMADALCAELRREGAIVPAQLACYLPILLDAALNRILARVPVVDLNGNAIRNRLVEAHTALMVTALNNPAWMDHPLYPDDYTRVTMLLADQLAGRMHPRAPRCALVVNTGIAEAMFAQTRLRHAFAGRIELIDTIAETSIGELDRDAVDFLIALDFVQTDLDYVRISGLVDRTDIERIERKLEAFEAARRAEHLPHVVEVPGKRKARDREQLLNQLFKRAAADGVWLGSAGEHRRALTACLFTRGRDLFAAVPSDQVSATTLYRHALCESIFVRGAQVNAAHVLYLHTDDPVEDRAAALHRLTAFGR